MKNMKKAFQPNIIKSIKSIEPEFTANQPKSNGCDTIVNLPSNNSYGLGLYFPLILSLGCVSNITQMCMNLSPELL